MTSYTVVTRGGTCINHCWHVKLDTLTSVPAEFVCCLCSGKRHVPRGDPEDSPEGHGPFHPGREQPSGTRGI